jgi:HIV Tat-specific factor 1
MADDENEPSTSVTETQVASKNVTYENGEAIYTDEATKYKYKWCKEKSEWKPMENEHYKWCEESQKWTPKVPLENEYYRWCDKTNQWIPKMSQSEGKTGVYGWDEKEECQTCTDQDGTIFLWVSFSHQ